MKCADAMERLDGYADGSLSEAEFQELELHLACCAACRKEEQELRSLLAEAAALPHEVEPARDLWPGIADRIGGGGRTVVPFAPRRIPAWGLAALAAAAAVVVALSTTLLRPTRPGATTPGGPTPGDILAPRPSGSVLNVGYASEPLALQQAEAEYIRATKDLMTALDGRRASFAPETLAVVDANLRIIDKALAEIHEALRKDPASPELARMLSSTHRKKIDVLQRVLRAKA